MTRKEFLQLSSLISAGTFLPFKLPAEILSDDELRRSDFGNDFVWGTATAAYQIEGAWNEDGKGESIWDHFVHYRNKKIKTRETGDVACDFYHRYESDIALMRQMNIPAFRFSLSWPRILPQGTGALNQKGIDFYHRVIDQCLEKNIEPWVTCYHWDMPQALQDKGGWTNRDVISWFEEYVAVCAKNFGDRVKNWMVMNEPMSFTVLGYILGWHAPGYFMKQDKFYAAVHHATLSQSTGGRVLREVVAQANIGTTTIYTHIEPKNNQPSNVKAAVRADAFLNRLFVEPLLGLGYPVHELHDLKQMEKFILTGDEQKMVFDFDFWGLQNYTRLVVKNMALIPMLHASFVSPKKLKGEITDMKWEVYPQAIYHGLKRMASYQNVKQIIVTENGAAFPDQPVNGEINDTRRLNYIRENMKQVLRAKQEGVNVNGYFIWSFMDNFEWAEGYKPRFGIVGVDFATQQRTVKASGKWFSEFLVGKM
ncbi:MAG: beta-glucosidase [Chitinophagales bacterium]|nr:beta-glucosidase [Chitinophagales bacterium]